MHPLRRLALALALPLALGFPPAAWAQEKAPDKPPEKAERATAPAGFDAQRTVTRHSLNRPEGALAYTATVEFLPLTAGAEEKVAARLFTTTYTLDGAEPDKRPVAFVFNGGPGAASAYLHLGALGPKVVSFGPDGALPPVPAPVVENPDSWLAFTDLVFIDPVGTGYSRATEPGEEAEKRFWGVEADARSLSEAVRLWTARNGRWASPKFLVGESYGGFRIAAMAEELHDQAGIAVNGLIMVSPVIDFATIRDDALLAPMLTLPSLAASAAAHGKAPGTPQEAARTAETFALNGYVTGLARLDLGRLEEARPFFAEVARTVGLPPELVERNRGRIPSGLFTREILRERGLIASVYDGTFTGADPTPGAGRPPFDPFLAGTEPVYSTAFAGYAAGDLGFRTDTPFRLLSDRVNRAWDWPRQAYPSAVEELQEVLSLQPSLRVMIAHGLTDLITPYMASRWIANRLELPDGQRERVTLPVYAGGHMMYTLPEPRRQLFEDARKLVEAATR
ncbi:septum formation initiator [Azospirillum sp. SYSU D00513]|uniref:S10 family peptidase n=1 Tax=Azospirillum sp. SYSU D00513 TaxID=2812561 RepID=UPI001A9621D4|nr:septum formation initiator [Azospirillum sp. SYSU D00513]